jgi:LCP family protein required for cell wall assembly
MTMKFRGCLRFFGRALLTLILLSCALWLLSAALANFREWQARLERRAVIEQHSTLFPATATALQQNRLSVPTPTPLAMLLNVRFAPEQAAHSVFAPPLLPTNTRRPTRTPDPSAFTPTPEPMPTLPPATSTLPRVPFREICTEKPQVTAVPPRAPRLRSEDDILNIILLGTDEDLQPNEPSVRTDTMVIVSINRTAGSVAMLSLPRDLYVCIPQLGMQRINVAYGWGESVGWSPNGGFGLLQETILYNFGIPIHFYAKVSFNGFKALIDALGGINLAVDCPMIDQLRFTGQYDQQGTPVYAPYTLDVGYYRMDGSLALWYARVRQRLSDFDRNRRQQQILRAIWREALAQGILQRAPELWSQASQLVQTNLQLQDVIGLLPIALSLTPENISSFQLIKGRETDAWRTPYGEDVQIPTEGMFETLRQFYMPPTRNRLVRDLGSIEVINGSSKPNYDLVAVDLLSWEGIRAVARGQGEPAAQTVIYDYTGAASPQVLQALRRALNIRADRIVSQPDPNRTVDFRIVLGADYVSCSAPGFGTRVN